MNYPAHVSPASSYFYIPDVDSDPNAERCNECHVSEETTTLTVIKCRWGNYRLCDECRAYEEAGA